MIEPTFTPIPIIVPLGINDTAFSTLNSNIVFILIATVSLIFFVWGVSSLVHFITDITEKCEND